jgi:hypothetical protein
MAGHGELAGEGKEGEGEEKAGGASWGSMGRGRLQGGTKGTPLSARGCCCSACSLFHAER